jgi:hypothetical protein
LDRETLRNLLTVEEDTFRACRESLEHGARFEIWGNGVSTMALANLYARRARTMQRLSQPSVGLPKAVEKLRSCDAAMLSIGFVDDRANGGYYFQLFLLTDLSEVVACFGVKASDSELLEGHAA